MKSFKKMFSARMFRAGSYSAFASVVVIAIAVTVNLLFSALPGSIKSVDVTEQSLYSLSDQTKRIVTALDKPVTMSLLSTTGQEDKTIKTLLDRYRSLSSNVTVAYVDPTTQPSFTKKYDMDHLYANSVLVECGEKYRLVSYEDIYVTDYTPNYTTYSYDTSVTFNGEQQLTSAIDYVTSDNLPKLYTLTGHGETALSDTLTTSLKQENYETADLSLLGVESVPEDADCVVINAPSSDLSAEESAMLKTYLDQGGSVVLTTNYIENDKMPNLVALTQSQGVEPAAGVIVEGDQNLCLRGYSHYIAPNKNSHAITDPLISGKYYVLTPIAQPITQTGAAGATVTALLTTSDKAYAKQTALDMKTYDKEDGDTDGPFDVAVAVEQNGGHFVWVTSGQLLDDQINQIVSGGNQNFFLNALGWMTEREESISIRAKSLDNATLAVPSGQSSLWSIVLIGLVPGALIAAGVIIWVRRKRK